MGKRLMRLFIELNKLGTTILIATHDQHLWQAFDYPRLHLEAGTLSRKPVAKENKNENENETGKGKENEKEKEKEKENENEKTNKADEIQAQQGETNIKAG